MLCKSALQLQAIEAENKRAKRRIDYLRQIISDDTTSIVQRSKAKVELAGLEHSHPDTRSSVTALTNTLGLVSKSKAKLERDVTRNKELLQREEEIKRIQQELRSEAAIKSVEVRQKLEERLVATQEAIDALVDEEADEMFDQVYKASLRTASTTWSSTSTFNTLNEEYDECNAIVDAASKKDQDPPSANKAPAFAFPEESRDPEFSSVQTITTLKGQSIETDEIIKALERQVAKLLIEAGEREAVLNDWKSKAQKISAACVALARDVEERDKSIQELEDSNRVHEERIACLQAEKLLNSSSSTVHHSNGGISSSSHQSIGSSMGSRRRFSVRASIDSSFSATLKRASMAGGINEQIREEAKIEMTALEERLAIVDNEKAELLQELKAMKAILTSTEEKKGNKKERLVYQLSCKKCNKHMNFIGTTDKDLKTTMEKHFAQVVKAAKGGKKKSKGGGSKVANEETSTPRKQQGNEDWSAEFAEHFAKHCKPALKFKSVSEKDVIKFCRENVKVEVLKRSDGSELFWEDHE